VFYLPTVGRSLPLEFAHCRPSKASLNTLGASGSTLGLAPSEHVSQTGSMSLLKQLIDKEAIQQPIFSLTLINGQEGILSIGGTAANAIEMVVSQTKNSLDTLGAIERGESLPIQRSSPLVKRGRKVKEVEPRHADWEEGWAWNKVQGADGWWQVLVQGIWVDGSKVLQNQAAVIDVQSPVSLRNPRQLTDCRSTALSFYLLHWQPKPFTHQYLALILCRPPIRTSTPFHASIHQS